MFNRLLLCGLLFLLTLTVPASLFAGSPAAPIRGSGKVPDKSQTKTVHNILQFPQQCREAIRSSKGHTKGRRDHPRRAGAIPADIAV